METEQNTPKPNVILLHDLIAPLSASIEELGVVKNRIENTSEQRILKALFLYSYAVFECTLTDVYGVVLKGFPERINLDNLNLKKHRNALFSSSLTTKVIDSIIEDYSRSLSYGGGIKKSLEKLFATLQLDRKNINVPDEIEKFKQYRNSITHNDALSIKADSEFILRYLEILFRVLTKLRDTINERYKDYTTTKLVRDSWNYLFNSPLLLFDNH
ncbi:MAG: hypothetical protein LBV18_06765 [Alistipes sp.]|jgi:hypothetical protein|nr:hypothetical protein [Alistipes sp.]